MEIAKSIDKYKYVTYAFFKWRYELALAQKLALALGFACLTGLAAQIRIHLPFTPIPITGQVFVVLLSGVILGRWYGGLSQAFYVGLGTAGIPWFAGSCSGISVMTGVTGGYLIGFVLAAIVIGWFVDNFIKFRTFTRMLLLMLLGVTIIYALGALQVSLILGTNFKETIHLAILPFILVDLLKATLAALIGSALAPKRSYNGEIDANS